MLRIFFIFIIFSSLHSQINNDTNIRAQNWHYIQQQIVSIQQEYTNFQNDKTINNQEFFNTQQQLGALYFSQRRYNLGFGTSLLPSECAVHNYVRKKTFLILKLKELMPIYKKYAEKYKEKYAKLNTSSNRKKIKELEKLNDLYLKSFDDFKLMNRNPINIMTAEKISSLQKSIKNQPFRTIKKSSSLLSWITPVAGIKQSQDFTIWSPLENAVILCPDSGIVTLIGVLGNSLVVFIKQNHFTYIITGINECYIKKGDMVKQGDILGFCAKKNPALVELQLWRDDTLLDPSPYHKAIQL
ncbi:MAG: hypothetical protein ACK4V2_01710 [Pseudomonadota bacterium]|jgi:hypothetical protein|nr:M23 family metallopeptidase [Alphaproteobacteria bacterium]